MKPTILCTLPFEKTVHQKIQRKVAPYQVRFISVSNSDDVDRGLEPSVEILLTGVAPSRLEQAPALKWVQLNSAGINHVMQSPIYLRKDLALTTARGAYDVAAAEFALGLMISLTRNFNLSSQLQRDKKWCPNSERLNMFPNQELRGRTVGIIGYGGIGQEIARLCSAFGMKPSALVRRNKKPGEARYRLPELRKLRPPRLEKEFKFPDGLNPILEQSDFVVLTLPLTPETTGLIDKAALARMHKNAYLINISRGALLNEEALVETLQKRRIAGAALDVFAQEPLPNDSPFYSLDNAVLTPHVSGVFTGMLERVADLFIENLDRYQDGKKLFNLVERRRGY
jgi:phosphoglycerate dehydrogenase-like enzyme